jgi:hypothetical protein
MSVKIELTDEQFDILAKGKCFYCNAPPSMSRNSPCGGGKRRYYGDYIYNGIDRRNNDEGYTFSNCVSCCQKCNWAKKNYSLEEFTAWVEAVYRHLHWVKGVGA